MNSPRKHPEYAITGVFRGAFLLCTERGLFVRKPMVIGWILTAVIVLLLIWANITIGWDSTGFHLNGLFNSYFHALGISFLVAYFSIVRLYYAAKDRMSKMKKGITIAIPILSLLVFIPLFFIPLIILSGGR